MTRTLPRALLALLSLLGSALVLGGPAGAAAQAAEVPPMIFVHGFLGSGQQFEAQALRLAGNGVPADHIEMFEHNSLLYPGSSEQVWAGIDALVAEMQDRTGADQVALLGHSQGTGVVQGYLNSSADRAGNVSHYVNLDGGAGGTVPASVDTLAIWGEGSADRQIPGATNVRFPNQAHTEVVNSPETFAAIYEFLAGAEPELGDVVREPADDIVVSGRAQLFPENTGATNATLRIFAVDGRTGRRLRTTPEASFPLSGEGEWGPFEADGDTYYEFAVERASGTHHVFLQRFVRSSRWVRILTSEPGGLADSFWELSERNQNVVVLRNKEWWGDQGAAGDTLTVNQQSVLNAATSPRTNRTIGIFVHDFGLDGVSHVDQPVAPFGVPFLTGIDLFLPAAEPPDGTVAVVATPRLGRGAEGVCIPNYVSTRHRSSIQFNSYHHLLTPDGKPAEGHPNPTCGAAPPTPPVPLPPPAPPVAGRPGFTG